MQISLEALQDKLDVVYDDMIKKEYGELSRSKRRDIEYVMDLGAMALTKVYNELLENQIKAMEFSVAMATAEQISDVSMKDLSMLEKLKGEIENAIVL